MEIIYEVATEVIKKCMLAHLAEKSGNPLEEKELSEEKSCAGMM